MPDSRLVPLVLDEVERSQLEAWSRRPKTAQALALRARIVLRCAAGEGLDANTMVAEDLDLGRGTVAKWRSRFLVDRLDGLLDEPRPGRPRTVTDEQVEQVVTATLESTPRNATHWSTRSLAAELGMSPSAVQRIFAWRRETPIANPSGYVRSTMGSLSPSTLMFRLHLAASLKDLKKW